MYNMLGYDQWNQRGGKREGEKDFFKKATFELRLEGREGEYLVGVQEEFVQGTGNKVCMSESEWLDCTARRR